MHDRVDTVRRWYDKSYAKGGDNAERRYPNEEFIRFMGRNFFGIKRKYRENIRILELGCGTNANLWVVAREGFNAYGLDLSYESIRLGKKTLGNFGVKAELKEGTMTSIPWDDSLFDAVVDVFSSYCLDTHDFQICLKEVARVLKPGGLFFSYTPSKRSDAFQNYGQSHKIDSSTLNGIYRKDSPFYGNYYTFRFIYPEEYELYLQQNGFKLTYLETLQRTYRNQTEVFEYVVVEGILKGS